MFVSGNQFAAVAAAASAVTATAAALSSAFSVQCTVRRALVVGQTLQAVRHAHTSAVGHGRWLGGYDGHLRLGFSLGFRVASRPHELHEQLSRNVARIELPYAMPFGFHGGWAPARSGPASPQPMGHAALA